MERATEIPSGYRWLVAHRRLVTAVASGAAGLLSLGLGWWGVTNTVVVADQLSYIASGGLLGLFLLGVAAIAYWGEQRERELAHIREVQLYLSAIAEALGLTEGEDPSQPAPREPDRTEPGPRASNGSAREPSPRSMREWGGVESPELVDPGPRVRRQPAKAGPAPRRAKTR